MLAPSEPRAPAAPRLPTEEAWYFTVHQQRALNAQPLLGPDGQPTAKKACYAHLLGVALREDPTRFRKLLTRFGDHPSIDNAYLVDYTAFMQGGCLTTEKLCPFVHTITDACTLQTCTRGNACQHQHSTCMLQHPKVAPCEDLSVPQASYAAMTQAVCASLAQTMAPIVAMLSNLPTVAAVHQQQQPIQATVVHATIVELQWVICVL